MDIDRKTYDSPNTGAEVETEEAKVLLSQNGLQSDTDMMKVTQVNRKYSKRDSTTSLSSESSDCTDNLVSKNEQMLEQCDSNKIIQNDQKEQAKFSEKSTKSNTCENCGQAIKKDSELNSEKPTSISSSKSETSLFSQEQSSSREEFCRICHCEGDSVVGPLIAPCNCKGTLEFIHQSCLQQWIKSSDYRHCELCGFHFAMNTKLKPLMKWEKLSMSTNERRKILCSVMFHIIAITCVIWSLQVLIERTAKDLKQGELQWPFWTKLIVVAIGFTGGLVFMYVQCKVYVLLWNRLKAFNRIIYVQDQPKSSVSPCKLDLNSTVLPNAVINNSSDNLRPASSHQDFVVVVEMTEQRESSL